MDDKHEDTTNMRGIILKADVVHKSGHQYSREALNRIGGAVGHVSIDLEKLNDIGRQLSVAAIPLASMHTEMVQKAIREESTRAYEKARNTYVIIDDPVSEPVDDGIRLELVASMRRLGLMKDLDMPYADYVDGYNIDDPDERWAYQKRVLSAPIRWIQRLRG